MLEKKLIPYVLLGYICAAYLELPTMAVAMVGAVFALIQYYSSDKSSNENLDSTGNSQGNLIEEEEFVNGI